MPAHAVGNINGDHEKLRRLAQLVRWSGRDKVVLVGDLIGRGMESLEVLRWARRNRDRVGLVLGNRGPDLRTLHGNRICRASRQTGKHDRRQLVVNALARMMRTTGPDGRFDPARCAPRQDLAAVILPASTWSADTGRVSA